MNRVNYIIILIILIVTYIVYFTDSKYVNKIMKNIKSIVKSKENYTEELPMKHQNLLYNHVDALKHKYKQIGRDFTGYFTKVTN